ncbi:hypothetical protein [Ensifer canadensis]
MTVDGRAAEEVFLGGHDDGVAGGDGSDLTEATKTAIALERSYGMGETLRGSQPSPDRGNRAPGTCVDGTGRPGSS